MMNDNLVWLLSKYIHRKDWLSFLKLDISFYEFGSLLSSGIDPSVCHNSAICWNAENGNDKIVELLLQDPRVDPSVRDNDAKKSAVIRGYDKIIELLLQDPRVKIH